MSRSIRRRRRSLQIPVARATEFQGRLLEVGRVESQLPQEMLNNMVASFTASNQIGEEMKKAALRKEKEKGK